MRVIFGVNLSLIEKLTNINVFSMNGQILFRLIFMLVGLLSATSIMADDRGAIYLDSTTDGSWDNDEMFLIGMPNGWPAPVEANRSQLEAWKLQTIVDGYSYYGAFDIAAGEAMFRFYNGLTGWDPDSYGCQVDDSPIEYSIASGDYQGECVRGKGSWSFPDWPGGTMYMFVSIYEGVHFSNQPISDAGVEDVFASGGCEIAALQGCVRVTAETDMRLTIYSLQGFVVKDVTVHAGVSYIELPSGLYIANGQKLWVR